MKFEWSKAETCHYEKCRLAPVKEFSESSIMRFPAIRILAVTVLFFGILISAAESISETNKNNFVVPIDWSKFKIAPAKGANAERFGNILLNANKYALGTWWT